MIPDLNMPEMRKPRRTGESFVCSAEWGRVVVDTVEIEVELPHVFLVEHDLGFGGDLFVYE